MIAKPGKNGTFPQNYRPISLLSSISKIAERVILKRLNEESQALHTILEAQFGFRSENSCELQVYKAKALKSQLSTLIGRRSKLRFKTKIRVANSIIMPVLTYASAAWGHTCKSNRMKIQRSQNQIIRDALKIPKYVPLGYVFRDSE
ncbi:uncharacterized protein [Diabrotica undecimpunctata]|uniref:uncharacterized protein n=1 Tax=Diabrotica undecimpunctata TaxID=50387 RepID=UPI003B636EBE